MKHHPPRKKKYGDQHESEQHSIYQIRVQGILDATWSDWFSGMSIDYEHNVDTPHATILTGAVADQSILRGILNSIWDLNLSLISVVRMEFADDDESGLRRQE